MSVTFLPALSKKSLLVCEKKNKINPFLILLTLSPSLHPPFILILYFMVLCFFMAATDPEVHIL